MTGKYKIIRPEEALKQCNQKNSGKSNIFIGYAPEIGTANSIPNEGNSGANRCKKLWTKGTGLKTVAEIGSLL